MVDVAGLNRYSATALPETADVSDASNISDANLQINLAKLEMDASIGRADAAKNALVIQMASVTKANADMANLNQVSSLLNQNAALINSTDATKTASSLSGTARATYDANVAKIKTICEASGMSSSYYEGTPTLATINTNVTDIKTKVDALSNTQSTDMLRLQQLNSTYTQAMTLASDLAKKFSDLNDAITQKI